MSVYKRGNKQVFYMNFTVNGIRVFKSTGCFTKKEAKAKEAEERRKLLKASNSKEPKAEVIKLSEAIEQVYEHKWKHNKDGDGSYKRAVRLILHIGDVPVNAINENSVQMLIKKLDSTSITFSTTNRYLATLKTILKYHHVPTHFIRLRKERSGRIRVVTREEELQITELLRGKTNSYFADVADLVTVLVDTGMRLSEMLNLSYKDISFKSNLVSVWINKGDKPRSIPMTRRVRQIMVDRQQSEKPFSLSVNQVEYSWSWVRVQMEMENDKEFVIHALRHTCASRLLNGGVDIYSVKEWLGHSSIKVTERYAHLAPGKLVQAVEVLEW